MMKLEGEISGRDSIIVYVKEREQTVDEIYGPRELTQLGLAEHFGKSRAHIAGDVGRLVAQGKLICIYRTIKGSRVKQKVYVSTNNPNIQDGERPATNREVLEELRRTNARLDRVLLVLSKSNPKG